MTNDSNSPMSGERTVRQAECPKNGLMMLGRLRGSCGAVPLFTPMLGFESPWRERLSEQRKDGPRRGLGDLKRGLSALY